VKRILVAARELLGRAFVAIEEKPLMVIVVAAGATVATSLVLASSAGWPRLLNRVYAPHSWRWLAVCLVGELLTPTP
jgi:hypothetical protein